jgi:UDP-N-acetylmuramoylalanine--D-glutamate ligase
MIGTFQDLDALTMAGVRAGALKGRPVAVLGFARSGVALARFLADAGARVTVYDARPASEHVRAVDQLEGRDIALELGPDVDPASVLEGRVLVTTSPAINPDYPTTEPRLRAALRSIVERRAAGDLTAPQLVSEADLFLRLCPAPTIGVTGTKGKTTTSSLIAAILAEDTAHPVVLGGNIGTPLVERLWAMTPEHRVVIELSELQLPTLSRGTTVAVYTNVTSDHLDRHGSLEAYRRVKRLLLDRVDPDGAAVINDDDPVVSAYPTDHVARVLRYRLGRPPDGGVGVDDGWVVVDGIGRILPTDDIRIPGQHNVANTLAGVAVGVIFGLEAEAIHRAVATFSGVEHRLEPVSVIDGVRFVNDSQGTQPDAVVAALRAFDPPIVLIAGGRDKGVDLSALAPVVAERAAAAVLIGESGPALESLFREHGLARTERAPTLEDAVTRADAIARESIGQHPDRLATVLLSPAAASFDMFVDYAARGRAFKDAVAALAAQRAHDQGRRDR